MFKKILRQSVLLSVSVLALSANASPGQNKEILAKQCRELSLTVASLVPSQKKSACVDKLHLASIQISTAGKLILEEANPTAKQELDDAEYTLQYAELNSCNRYIQISHSKFEAQRIKNQL